MNTKALDIVVDELPFEAGGGFFATVEGQVAHIVTFPQKTTSNLNRQTAKEWLANSRGIFKKEKVVAEDDRLFDILTKHAPELLD
jgi:hypothetical protein